MSNIHGADFTMLQLISSVLTILLSGVVAATSTFIMNSSKEHSFQLRQKGEDLVGEILRLRGLLINKNLISTKITRELRAEMESIIDANGKYKNGKNVKDEDNFMIGLYEKITKYKNDLDEKISQSFVKIELLTSLYFYNNIDDLNNIKEKISAMNHKLSGYKEIGHVENLEMFDKEIKELENFNKEITVKIVQEFDIFLGKTIKNVSVYTYNDIVIPNIISKNILIIKNRFHK